MFTARSGSPLNVRTGLDLDGTRLYGDRGGRARNSAEGPPYHSLDAFAYRRLPIPYLKVRSTRFFVDATFSAENLLGDVNYATVGSVLASAFFGQPVAAQPGRTARMSFRISRSR